MLTGNLRKRPIREVQPEYRPTHSLNCAEVMMRYGFQMQMMGANLCGQAILNDCVSLMEELLLADSVQ